MSIGGVTLSKITIKTRANSSWRRCLYTLSQHLDREVFIRLNTSWRRCSYTVYEQCINVNTEMLSARASKLGPGKTKDSKFRVPLDSGRSDPVAEDTPSPVSQDYERLP